MSRPEHAGDSITRNTVFAAAVRLTGAAFTAILTIFLVRYLGPKEYGVFVLAMGVGDLMTVPLDLGISLSAAPTQTPLPRWCRTPSGSSS